MLTGKRENNSLEGLSWFISAALVHSPRPTFAIIIKKQTKKQKKKKTLQIRHYLRPLQSPFISIRDKTN